MSAAETILAECLVRPDDDAPRLVWADAIGGERGELVGLQCGRAGRPAAELGARNRRERELLEAHALDWSGLAGLARRVRFRRGFVDAIEVDADTWIAHGERIVAIAPFATSLAVVDVAPEAPRPLERDEAGARLAQVIHHPAFARMRGLDLAGRFAVRDDPWAETATRVLVETGAAARLVALGLPVDHSPNALVVLASGHPERLERLWLRGSNVDDGALRELVRAAPRLTSLDARSLELPIEDLADLAPNLVELAMRHTRERELARLAETSLAARLERLILVPYSGGHRAPDLSVLARCTRLAALEIRDYCSDDMLAVLGTIELPALRELRLAWTANAPALDRIVRHLGPQLELFDLRETIRFPPRPLAGDVLVHEPGRRELLHVHATEPASWHVTPAVVEDGAEISPCWLVAETGSSAGRIWDLTRRGDRRILVGRSSQLDVALADDTVGRVHAVLTWTGTGHMLQDMGSTNGVVIGGTRIGDPVPLRDRTQVVLGRIFLRYFIGPGGGERASAHASGLASYEPITGLRRRTAPDAARVRIAQLAELARHYGAIATDVVFGEVARRLAAAGGKVIQLTTPAYGEFGVHPASAAPDLVAACNGPVSFEGEEVPIALQIASPA